MVEWILIMGVMFLILIIVVVDVEVEAGIGAGPIVEVLLHVTVAGEDHETDTMIVNIAEEEEVTVAADLAVTVEVVIGEIGTVEGGIVEEIRREMVEGDGVVEAHLVEVNGDLHVIIVVVGV